MPIYNWNPQHSTLCCTWIYPVYTADGRIFVTHNQSMDQVMYDDLEETTNTAFQRYWALYFSFKHTETHTDAHCHTLSFPGPAIQLQTPVLFNRSWHQIGIISV